MVGSPSGVPASAVAAAPGNVLEMQIPSTAPPRLRVRNPGDGQEASASPQRVWVFGPHSEALEPLSPSQTVTCSQLTQQRPFRAFVSHQRLILIGTLRVPSLGCPVWNSSLVLLVRPDPDVFEEAGQLLVLIDGGSVVKHPPANTGDGGSIPGCGRPLEKGMATQSSILVWRIPWTEAPGGLQSMGSQSPTRLSE